MFRGSISSCEEQVYIDLLRRERLEMDGILHFLQEFDRVEIDQLTDFTETDAELFRSFGVSAVTITLPHS